MARRHRLKAKKWTPKKGSESKICEQFCSVRAKDQQIHRFWSQGREHKQTLHSPVLDTDMIEKVFRPGEITAIAGDLGICWLRGVKDRSVSGRQGPRDDNGRCDDFLEDGLGVMTAAREEGKTSAKLWTAGDAITFAILFSSV